MKKLFSFILTLILVLSLGLTAFAADGDTATGSITITNATIGDTYTLYKIFNATYRTDADGNTNAISYSIDKTDPYEKPIFEALFGADGTKPNPYFVYNPTTGEVTGNGTIDKAALSTDMKALVKTLAPAQAPVTATSSEVRFEGLEFGYYVIDKSGDSDAIVTITNAAPDIEVIDKNQLPGNNLSKLVLDEDLVNEDGTPGVWVTDSSANIGDIVDFKVSFEATNYDGERLIKQYTIGDTKGNALWVEFESITVTVGGERLTNGYYHCTTNDPTIATGDWEYLNGWVGEKNPQNADWYLIHHGFDDFDIVIPWLNNHTFTVNEDLSFELSYPETDLTSRFVSPASVVIQYNASVEPGANIVGKSNLYNEAELSWTDIDNTTTTSPLKPRTNLTVHALGVTKTDEVTGELLSGAVFQIYHDKEGTSPIYVIPTNVEGVYILDDLNTIVTGDSRETSRKKYAEYLDDYLKGETQKNEVTTQANGKLVILGLEKGTYWLKETVAPNGYNKLATPVSVTIDGITTDYIFAIDDEGKVITSGTAAETITYKAKDLPIANNKGVELPSTGGEGTMRMITIGTIVALAFAVLLITHKKMSTYQD